MKLGSGCKIQGMTLVMNDLGKMRDKITEGDSKD